MPNPPPAGQAPPLPSQELPRLGPRPLPLHLATAAWTWMSSEIGLQQLSGASPSSSSGSSSPQNPELLAALAGHLNDWDRALVRLRAALLARSSPAELPGLVNGPFALAVRREALRRLDRLAQGVEIYRRHPARRDLPDPPAIWREGGSRLLDFGPTAGAAADAGGVALLMVPSLVNRWHVLDISAERSLMRALAQGGIRSFVVDWGDPVGEERQFDATAYVLRLERMLDRLRAAGHRRIVVGGYCMGGLLALALACRRAPDLAGLALLATPWDFHADRAGQGALIAALPILDRVAAALGELPVDAIQTLFYALDPWLVINKFMRLAALPPDSPQARDFVLLEDWLNEGPPLAGPLARDCLTGWYGANTPGRAAWRIAGAAVDPRRLALPALVVVPGQDRIVPPAAARALAPPGPGGIPGARRLDLPLGHIGMVVGGKGPELLWRPLLAWLRDATSGGEGARAGRA